LVICWFLDKYTRKKFNCGDSKIIWLCQCDCGNEKYIGAATLISGQTSCSTKCKFNPVKGIYGESSFNQLYRTYKYGALKRNYSFNLSKEEFKLLTNNNCYYCGCAPNQIITDIDLYGDYTYNGIDRLDNNIGYEINNCVSCCKICNIMKWDMNIPSFISHMKQILKHLDENYGKK
jgi:hypothetical protein